MTALAFRTDGRTLASGDENGNVRLWDPDARTELGSAQDIGGVGSISQLAFNPDGTTLAVASGAVKIWSGFQWRGLEDLQRQVCSLTGSGLTPAEWTEFAPGVPFQRVCAGRLP